MNKFTLSVVASRGRAACGMRQERRSTQGCGSCPGRRGCAGGAAAADRLVIKIGHVGPTSGAIAHLGKDNEMARAWPSTTSTPRA